MSRPGHIDLDNPGDCKAYADLYERTKRELDVMTRKYKDSQRILKLCGDESTKWANESGMAKGRLSREQKRASFYKSCALSGEVPSAETIARMDMEPV